MNKKKGLFDVTMGSNDGAEICELIGLYLLFLLSKLNLVIGLYRDDGLVSTDKSPKQCEDIKKKFVNYFLTMD